MKYMASTSTQQSSPSPRRLADHLTEQQEPFVLDIYLLERGYRISRSLDLDGRLVKCCSNSNYNNNSKKLLKKSSSYHVGANPAPKYNKPAQFSSIVGSFFTKFASSKWRKWLGEKQVVELPVAADRCSSISCSTAFSSNTWSDSETDGGCISMPSPVKDEVFHDESAPNSAMTVQWQFFEENKQCSPDSVLEEIDLLQSIPVYNNVKQPLEQAPSEARIRFQKKVSEDAILSASLWELLTKLMTEKSEQKRGRKPFPDYMNTKRTLQQNRQLLFDCVREAVESKKQQTSTSSTDLIMGPEEIGKSICKNLKTWGNLSADETNIKMVSRKDLLGSTIDNDWGSFDAWKIDIVGEIGNAIADEIIENQLIDMVYQL